MKPCALILSIVGTFIISAAAQAQVIIIDRPVPLPRPRPVPTDCQIRSVDVHADVRDQIAKVQFTQVFKNNSSSVLEAKFIFPIPDEAAVSELTLLVDGKELTGKLLGKDEARRIYEAIVQRQRDPALLEYIGQGLFQTSVFPIPANAERKVEIRYSQLLKKDSGLIDLILPVGTTKHAGRPIEAFNVTVRIEGSEPLKTVYSPTHHVSIERPDDRHAVCKLSLNQVTSPNDVRLMYSMQSDLVGMNLVSYRPNDKEDGYFMLLASPDIANANQQQIPKTIICVVDRSGSMSGEKIEQAREALKFLIGQLRPDDTFNLIAFDSSVESFRPELQRVNDETKQAALSFANSLVSGGSTNIDEALQTALRMLTDSNRPSYVLFLTDGQPTVGEQDEMQIVARAESANKVAARVFNFGVGFDVNSRLLDRLSRELRGQSVYVLPNEKIEAHVAALANKIGSPLLTDLKVGLEFDVAQAAGAAAPISRTYPREFTDLFAGEQLVWVGRYRQTGPVKVTLSGTAGGEQKTFTTTGMLVDRSSDDNHGFVEKVWATRRIGEIIDELDLKGHNQELINELVQLSIRHGIMTPYTSFLANENVDLADASNAQRASGAVREQLSVASGENAFGQRLLKNQFQAAAQPAAAHPLPAINAVGGAPGNAPAPEAESLRSVGQKTFFRKNNRWQDSTVSADQEQKAIRIRQYSPEYFELAARDQGRFAKYLAFEEPVVLEITGQTYQIDPAE